MDSDEHSFMCIADAATTDAKGALCAEADIGPASDKTYKVKTYSIPAASVDTKLQEWTALKALSGTDTPYAATVALKDYNFDQTTADVFRTMPKVDALVSGPPATGAAATVKSQWEGFQMFKCTATSITITCNNWVVESGKTADGGY